MALLLTTRAAAAATTPTVWQGDVFFTAVSSTCTTDGIASVGGFNEIVYRPDLVFGESPEALSLITTRSAYLLEAPSGKTLRTRNATADVTLLSSRADVILGTTTVTLKFKPAKITATTPVVQISGTINNLFNTPAATSR